VASFVRSVQADSQAAESTLTPNPVQREFERAMQRAQTPREPKAAVTDVTPAIVVRSYKRVVWFAALGLLAGVGVGVAWYARHRRSAPMPAAVAPATAASPTAAPPAPRETAPPPVPPAPPAPAIEEPPTELVPPPMHPRRDVGAASGEPAPKRGSAHTKRPAHDPSPAPAVEKWGADPAPASPR
jgi:hypothetical protein